MFIIIIIYMIAVLELSCLKFLDITHNLKLLEEKKNENIFDFID